MRIIARAIKYSYRAETRYTCPLVMRLAAFVQRLMGREVYWHDGGCYRRMPKGHGVELRVWNWAARMEHRIRDKWERWTMPLLVRWK